jgi:predicted secreted protein
VVTPVADSKARLRARPDHEAAGVLSRVFGGQDLGDGADSLRVHIAHIVDEGLPAALDVEVRRPHPQRRSGARLYIIADENRVPLLARVELHRGTRPQQVSLHVRLDASTHLRVVLGSGDSTLLQVARWVWVLPRELIVAEPERRSR